MRLIHIAGLPGSGKTALIRRCCDGHDFGYIANNPESAETMKGICDHTDFFPFKSSCARARQYMYRVGLMMESFPDGTVITEPPGNCLDVSAPLLNPIYVSKKQSIEIGPLIAVIDGRTVADSIRKNTAEGLRTHNMVYESDVIAITFSDLLSDEAVDRIREGIHGINPDAVSLFCPSEEDCGEITRLIFGDSAYSRPLNY